MQFTEITENSQLVCNGKTVQNKRFIAHGASANVFLSEYDGREVVVKAIREQSGSAFYGEFQREAETMQMLWNNWQEAYGDQFPQVVPEYIGGESQGEAPFIVEEYINGKTLNEAMSELPQAVFSEPQALHLAAQIGRMLYVLHNKLGRCYGDIKFDNFLVVGDVNDRCPKLKVIDWNVLAYPSERNIQKDLLYVTKYIVFILTGLSIKLNVDQLEAVLPRDFTDTLKNLSIGTQRFILRGLHPNLADRYQTAQEWLEAILEVDQYWDMDAENLLTQAQNTLEMSSDSQELEIAQKKASVAQLLKPSCASDLLDKLSDRLSGDTAIANIKKYLASNNAKDAVRSFRSALSRGSTPPNEGLVLWSWLAMAADQLDAEFLERYGALEKALDARLKNQFKEAEVLFGNLNAVVAEASSALGELQLEAKVGWLIDRINTEQENDFQNRVNILNQAFDEYQKLPDDLQRLILRRYNLPQKREEAIQGEKKLEEAMNLCEQAANPCNGLDYQLRQYRQAIAMTPDTGPVFEYLKAQVLATLNAGEYDKCQRLALTPRQDGKENEWFSAAITAARELDGLRANFNQAGMTYHVISEIDHYVTRFLEFRNTPAEVLYYSSGFKKFLTDVFDAALTRKSLTEAETISDIYKKIWPEDHTIGQRLSQSMDEFNNLTKQQIYGLLNSSPLSDEVFENASRMIADFKNLLRQQDVPGNIDDLNKRYKERFIEWEAEKEKRDSKSENIGRLVAQVKDKIAQCEKLEIAEQNSPVSLRNHFRQQMPPLLFSVSMALKELEKLGYSESELSEWEDWVEKRIDLPYMIFEQNLKSQGIHDRQSIIRNGLKTALEEGRLEEAVNFLNHSDVDLGSYADQRELLKKYLSFLNWSEMLPVNDDPTDWIKAGIPGVYWDRSRGNSPSAIKYFGEKAEKLLESFTLDKLPELARARWVSTRIMGGGLTLQTSSSWQAICLAAQVLDSFLNSKKNKGKQSKDASEERRLKDDLLNRIDNLKYESIGASPGPEKAKSNFRTRLLVSVLGTLVVLFALGLIIVSMWGKQNGVISMKPMGLVTPTSVFVNQETQKPRITPAEETPTPVITTEVPIDDTPVSVSATPTPVTVSKFSAYVANSPLEPMGIDRVLYVIDNTAAEITGPETIQTVVPKLGVNGSMYKVEAKDNKEEVSVTWTLDQPLYEDGIYEFFVYDALTESGMNLPINYEVLANNSPADLIMGNGKVQLATQYIQENANSYGTDVWRSIGVYRLQTGVTPSVRLIIPPETVTGYYKIGIDAIMIAKLPQFSTEDWAAKDLDQKGRQVVMIVDDAQVKTQPDEGWIFVDNSNAWLNNFRQLQLDGTIGATVTWEFANHPLSPGEYFIQFFIPAENTVDVIFNFKVDGKIVEGLETYNLIAEANAGGTHWPEQGWRITVPPEGIGRLVVEMTVPRGSTGVFAIDAMVLSVEKPQ